MLWRCGFGPFKTLKGPCIIVNKMPFYYPPKAIKEENFVTFVAININLLFWIEFFIS